MITAEKINEFKSLFEAFKLLDSYKSRQQQKLIAPLFKDIIIETLKNDTLKNEQLTGLIQMFGWRCKPDNFRKYMELCVKDKKRCEQLIEQSLNTAQRGFTNIGKTAVTDLNPVELNKIKAFLLNSFTVKAVDEAVALCKNFEDQNIPQVKQGIFSPWLYYINPALYPMVNNSHANFKKWFGVSKNYFESISEYHQFKEASAEPDFAGIDYFAHILTNEGKLNYRRHLELNGKSIYKISHGIFSKKFKDSGVWEILAEKKWVCLHEKTGKRQGEKFVDELQIGDYVYVCYGGDELSFIGKIKSNIKPLPKELKIMLEEEDQPWIYREVDVLFEPKKQLLDAEMKQFRDAYMPSANYTFAKVPELDLDWINSVLFIPYYNIEVIGDDTDDGELNTENDTINTKSNSMSDSKNTILYGPPGTFGRAVSLRNSRYRSLKCSLL